MAEMTPVEKTKNKKQQKKGRCIFKCFYSCEVDQCDRKGWGRNQRCELRESTRGRWAATHRPLTGLACPGWESIHGSLLPVFPLPYIFKVMWKHKALWVWSLDQQSWALAGNWSDKFLGPMPDLLNQRLRVNSARVKGLKWWFSDRSVHPMHLEGLL